MSEYRDTHIHLNKYIVRKLKSVAAENDTNFKTVVNSALTAYAAAYETMSNLQPDTTVCYNTVTNVISSGVANYITTTL